MSLPHFCSTVWRKDHGLSTCKPWSKQAGGWIRFCMKQLRTLNSSQIFKIKIKKIVVRFKVCPTVPLSNLARWYLQVKFWKWPGRDNDKSEDWSARTKNHVYKIFICFDIQRPEKVWHISAFTGETNAFQTAPLVSKHRQYATCHREN